MFDDFGEGTATRFGTRHFGGSLAWALALCCGAGTVVVTTSQRVRQRVEDTALVVFAPSPERSPPPPPPPPAAPSVVASTPRPKTRRPALVAPAEVPQQVPQAVQAPSPSPEAPGPVDGFIGGVSHGEGAAFPPPPPPAPPPPPVKAPPKLVPAQELPGNKSPRYPKSALRRGIAGDVVVAFDVMPDGSVSSPKIVSGPEELRDAVLEAALTWRFRPATLDGKPVRRTRNKTVTFRLEDP